MIIAQPYTSRPTKGEMLIAKAILTVGSSTFMDGNGFPVILSAIVSPIWNGEIYLYHDLSEPVGSRK